MTRKKNTKPAKKTGPEVVPYAPEGSAVASDSAPRASQPEEHVAVAAPYVPQTPEKDGKRKRTRSNTRRRKPAEAAVVAAGDAGNGTGTEAAPDKETTQLPVVAPYVPEILARNGAQDEASAESTEPATDDPIVAPYIPAVLAKDDGPNGAGTERREPAAETAVVAPYVPESLARDGGSNGANNSVDTERSADTAEVPLLPYVPRDSIDTITRGGSNGMHANGHDPAEHDHMVAPYIGEGHWAGEKPEREPLPDQPPADVSVVAHATEGSPAVEGLDEFHRAIDEPDASAPAATATAEAVRQVKLPKVEPDMPETNGHSDVRTNGHSNGHANGHDVEPLGERTTRPLAVVRDTPAEVRPVKVRLGNSQPLGPHASGANGNGHRNGHSNGKARFNGNGFAGEKARVALATGDLLGLSPHTARLRDTDITGLRLRLKTQEFPATRTARRSNKRDLPYFLMRHRVMRSRSRVGHARAQAAARRHGNGGALSVVMYLILIVTLVFTMVAGAGMGGAIAGGAYYVSQLPPVDPNSMAAALVENSVTAQTTRIYDRNGIPLYELVDEETGRREELALNEIAKVARDATIAAEDATFYENPGVEPIAIIRALRINLGGDGSSGASTITQQVARNTFMTVEERQERSYERKIKEAMLALQLTATYSKDDILALYLNQSFYGHRAYGIGAAARTYFGKSAADLNLAEASLLAGLVQLPAVYDPFVNYEAAKRRQAYVLDQMAKLGMITAEEAEAAKNADVALNYETDEPEIKAPHFVYYVKEYLEKKYGPDVAEAGLKVYTTLDMDVQNAAQQVAKDRIDELRRQRASNAAIVLMKPSTGEILGMVGSVDYYDTSIDGQVNVATRERQPGSSFKPITYVTAFKKGWTPGTVLLDALTAFPNPGQKPYTPRNYDGRDHGWVTVREALGNSYNIPAVKALQFAGLQDVIDTAHDMGIKGLNRGTDWYGLSLTLGGGEVTLLDMTTAYSTFANYGEAVDANPILRIEDPQGRIIYQLDQSPDGNQALDPRHAYMITSILSDNRARSAAFGPNSPLRTSFPAAAKTGTTDDNRDSWTMGYTPNLTVGVWVGNSDNSEMLKVTGAIGAAVVWHNMMETFYNTPEFV
ncbi:MAG TPA: PBP1A family penicillin-binding protein, partial [Chloroflexia bacterium]|nr:PBP1A family penicillin-binding protein [Chloroflexia bacterium]